MNVLIFIYMALLFFILTPNILIRIPPSGGKYLVAGIHALLFAVLWGVSHNYIFKLMSSFPTISLEKMQTMEPSIYPM